MSSTARAYRILLAVILSLFLFNALLDRLAWYVLGIRLCTRAFYVLIGVAVLGQVILTLRSGTTRVLQAAAAAWLAFVVALGLAYGDVAASVVAIKQFF